MIKNQDVSLVKLVDEISSELVKISPKFSEAFLEPATRLEIDQFIEKIGPIVPTELISFFKVSKGCLPTGPSAFAYDLQLTSIKDCISSLQTNIEIANEFEDSPLELDYADIQIDSSYEYSSTRIPIAAATRMQICIDLSPTEHGTLGQIIFIDSEYKVGIFLACTLTEFLKEFLHDLAQGYYELGKYSNDFLSCKTEISLSNWQWSDRWSRIPFDRSTLAPLND